MRSDRRGPASPRNGRGLSEIVGTLFLVLIVVAAATAFSVFVATYQKQLQSEQAYNQQRGLESLGVVHLVPYAVSGASHRGEWAFLNFTLASFYVGVSTITEISINDNPVANYTAFGFNLTTGAPTPTVVGLDGQLRVASHEQLSINVSVLSGVNATGRPNSGLLDPSVRLLQSSYLRIDVFTSLENDFVRLFVPPTALAVVGELETFNGSGFTPTPLLDGSGSIAGANATIVAWNWTVTQNSHGTLVTVAYGNGVKVVLSSLLPHAPPNRYNATLNVTDSNGLTSSDTVPFGW